MGLDTTHNAWHGAYSAFMRWRQIITKAAGLPPLLLMDGFYSPLSLRGLPTLYAGAATHGLQALDEQLPIKWECLKPDPIHILLHHSDCDGEIAWADCGPIADSLERILPSLPKGDIGGHIGDVRDKTEAFIAGLRLAFERKENLEFN